MRRLGVIVAVLALAAQGAACGTEEPERDFVTVSIDGAPAVTYVEGEGVNVTAVPTGSGGCQIQGHLPGLFVVITLDSVPTSAGPATGDLMCMVEGWSNTADPVTFEITAAGSSAGQPIAGSFPTTALTGSTASSASGSFRATREW
jgi:hypothetical protein